MRITGGRARGIQLQSPATDQTRPATDYLREALFSSLGQVVAATRVLDLYAGTGAYGLEALSRGAQHTTFVEKNRSVHKCLKENICRVCKSLGITDPSLHTQTLHTDALKWTNPSGVGYDLIIADPPYPLLAKHSVTIIRHALSLLSQAPHSVLVLEAPGEFTIESLPAKFRIKKRIAKHQHQPSAILIESSDEDA